MTTADLPEKTPVTWLVLGDKRGDNGQVEAIVNALGWPCIRKYVHMQPQYALGKPRFKASLDHLDLSQSDPLEPPWPDLVITIGRRPSMAALWIKAQSGNKTRIVLIGKPTGKMRDFELVVASAENQLPPLPNFLPITLPLMQVDPQAVAAEAALWQKRLAPYPRPLIGVLVGGETNPFKMTKAVAHRLVATVKQIRSSGGTAYVTTSRRTNPEVVEILRTDLPKDTPLFCWSVDAQDNPYRALLGSADGFIVTGDSISMMVEVIRLGKPLAIFPLPTGVLGTVDQLRRSFARWLFNPDCNGAFDRWRHRVGLIVYYLDYFKLLSSTRDFRHFHQLLVKRKLAVWAGEPFNSPPDAVDQDLDSVVTRIKSLILN